MSEPEGEALSVAMEREFPFPPERIWRALTQPHLLEEWLMKTDFRPDVGQAFSFSAEWGSVRGEVLDAEPHRSLSYTWGDDHLRSIVTWTLTPTRGGTLLRMEQTGFRRDQPRYFMGAKAGWPRFFDNLEQLLAKIA
ncbi:MAG TPA: SRPBCC domain-containing protein [Hyphomonas sp.]|nr:SRPBCC domain-containing protein [Hyphomonas sp.]MCA8904724.1 SRPBCC domain-containing protein [Hyphomonas sp.]MCB9970836.1 SRPBCC domain-containing protein [Hyphomonas sp.]HPE46989.1 SRPBCC domain-containing protein [Hyphomonas sp.]